MKDNRARKRLGPISTLFAVLMVATVGASPALAASTSATSSESLTVTASISLSGVPATLTYSSVNAGQLSTAPEFSAAVSSNNVSGWTFAVNATALTAGAATIPATAREYVVSGTGFTATGGGSPTAYPGGDFTLASRTTGGANNVFVTSRVIVPAAAAPGAYTGQAVFTASTNP